MAEKPVVHNSATSFAWGAPTLLLGVVVGAISANNRTDGLSVVGLALILLGLVWIVQGIVRSARNRDAMARALLEVDDDAHHER